MKRIQRWIAFVIPLFFHSCISDPALEHDPAPPLIDKLLTVGEARAYFEQQISHETRSGHARLTLLPENFTPEWNDAIQAENGRVTRVDIPILSNIQLRALRSEYTDCAAQPYIGRCCSETGRFAKIRFGKPFIPISDAVGSRSRILCKSQKRDG